MIRRIITRKVYSGESGSSLSDPGLGSAIFIGQSNTGVNSIKLNFALTDTFLHILLSKIYFF